MKLTLTDRDFETLVGGNAIVKEGVEIKLANADPDELLRCLENALSKGRGREADG